MIKFETIYFGCPNCGATIRSHRACPKCGTYNGKKVVSVGE